MAEDIVFIGDEVTAAGFRLAGLRCHVPDDTASVADLAAAAAAGEARIVMMTADCAARLPARRLAELEAGDKPLFAIVPDARERAPVPDLERAVRRVLGIEPAT